MKNYSNLILNTLLDKYEGSSLYKGDNLKDIKVSLRFTKESLPDYFNEYRAEYKNELNEQCLSLKDSGYIDIKWKKFQEGNIIEKVILNIEKLDSIYNHLKRNSRKDFENRTIEILLHYCGLDNWLGNFTCQMKAKIEKNISIRRYLDIEDPETTHEVLYMLEKIINQQKEIPRRVFSVQYFNDSKKLEKLETRLIRIMTSFGGFNADMDVLAQANIIKNPGYVYMKGNVVISCSGEIIDLKKLYGEIGLSTSLIENLEVKSIGAKRVITIENLTTFHSYISKDDFVIYLGGYHNEVRRKFLVKLYKSCFDAEFFHWGDIDLGGFRIFNHLKSKTGIPFIPLYMDKSTLLKFKDYLKPIEDMRYIDDLKKLLSQKEYMEFYEVIAYMIENSVKLEQEALTEVRGLTPY